jgi:putative toxin-antitoxin system antitoxin component (TIGR02293 family)
LRKNKTIERFCDSKKGGNTLASLPAVALLTSKGPQTGFQKTSILDNRQFAAYIVGRLPLADCGKEAVMSIAIVEEVARKLGGQNVLGQVVRSQADLAQAVRNRLPLLALRGLSQAGLTEQEIEKFVIPQRTRRHRADRQQPLTVDESDRAVRLLRVQSLAEQTFGDRDKANLWLRRPLMELGGETPLAVAQTEAGARVIETVLGKIAWGAAA